MKTLAPTTTFPDMRHDAPMYSYSVADPAASTSGGAVYTSMPHETLSPKGQFAVSVYAYIGIAFLIATFLFGVGYAIHKLRRDRGKRNYDLDNPFYDPNENTRYVSKKNRLSNSMLGKLNPALASDVRKKQAKDAKAGRKSSLDKLTVPSPDQPYPLIRSGSSYGTVSNRDPAKRVSWASTTSTIHIDDDDKKARTNQLKSADGIGDMSAPARPRNASISSLPRTQDPHARVNVAHMSDPRALRSRELVGNTTPDLCQNWATPDKAGYGVDNFLSSPQYPPYR